MINQSILKIMELAHREQKPLANVMLKLVEEIGELGEAVNHHEGYLPHKDMKEGMVGEVADVVQCAVTVLVKAYPESSDHALLADLKYWLDRKNEKWESLPTTKR